MITHFIVNNGVRSNFMPDPTIGKIAATYGKTPAQVMLRWHVRQGRQVIPTITRETFGRDIPEA
jgi:diketogulonate reductase-like aldo/keto reductase